MAFFHVSGLGWRAVYLSDKHILVALRAVVCTGFAAGLLLSWRLWTGAHSFPLVPLLPLPLPPVFQALLGGGLLLSLTALVFFPRRTWIATAWAALLGLALLDQMCWQPWAYQYALMLLPFFFFHREPGPARLGTVLDVQRLIVAAVYFWSGVHKIGPGFTHLFDTYLASDLLGASAPALHPLILAGGRGIPWIEVGIGIGLLFRRTAPWAGGLALLTHLVILLLIGPLGKAANSVVWPWNLAMMALVGLLFFPGRSIQWRNLGQAGFRYPTALIVLLVWIMPIGSFAKKWDRYLSFHLYSGQQQRVVVFFDAVAAAQVPGEILAWTKPSPLPGYRELNLSTWSMAEMNVPVVSEDRIILALAKQLAALPIESGEWYFHRDYPHLLASRGWAHYSPGEIRALHRFPPLQLPASLRKK
ncbi:MAG: MauE/DoxX family redox-associated membrane protein [Verrucomicrobiota bacterium]